MHVSKLLMIALIAGASTTAFAQPKTGMRAELDALKKEVASLQVVAATAPTLAQALQDLSSKLVLLENELAAKTRASDSMPEAISRIDGLQEDINNLRIDLEYLRTSIANIEQPAAVSTGGSAEHDKGMRISTGDGLYDMTIGGYVQPRYQLDLPEDFSSLDSAGFRMRRARLGLTGKMGSDRLHYKTELDLNSTGASLLDFYADMRYRPALTIRVGQGKVPYTRAFLASSQDWTFFELSKTQQLQHYERDVGLWALGSFLDGRLRYHAGFSNGAGPNQRNTNIDVATAVRLEGAVLGKFIKPGYGDQGCRCNKAPRLTVGAAFVHDLVRLPENISGIAVDNQDVDGNGLIDNVRVLSSTIDAQLRYRGWELAVEGTWRHERWGSILAHDDNSGIATAVDASNNGRRNYLGFTAEATYFVMPKLLLLGTRVSHGRLPLLGLGGRNPSEAPLAQRAWQADGLVQLYRQGHRRIGFMYSLVNYDAKNGADPENDIGHSLMVEAQFVL